MAKRWLMWTGVWVAVSGLCYLTIYWVLATLVAVLGLTVLVVVLMASDWDSHPSFDDRELARARRRKLKRQRTAGARAKDRARWEAYQGKKAARG